MGWLDCGVHQYKFKSIILAMAIQSWKGRLTDTVRDPSTSDLTLSLDEI
jgi:hypothetical protein